MNQTNNNPAPATAALVSESGREMKRRAAVLWKSYKDFDDSNTPKKRVKVTNDPSPGKASSKVEKSSKDEE